MARSTTRLSALLIGVLLLAGIQDVHAQSNVHYGIKIGPTFTQVSGLRLASGRSGYSAGAFVGVNVPNLGRLNLEVWYAQKGYTVEFDEFLDLNGERLIGNVDADFQLNYLEIPVLLNLAVPVAPQLAPEFFFGAALSYLMNEDVTFQNTEPEDEEKFERDRELFDKTDFGLVIGLRFNRPMGQRTASLETRYTLGIVNLTDDGLIGNSLHNRALTIVLGIEL